MQWYYVKDGKQHGPVDEQKIRDMLSDGVLKQHDLIWNETFGEKWLLVSDVPEFQPYGNEIVDSPPEGVPPALPKLEVRELKYDKKTAGPSFTTVLEPAFQRMKNILFRPFDFGKWCALGVSAFLATLGDGGGSSGGNVGSSGSSPSSGNFDVDTMITGVERFLEQNSWVIPLAIGLTVLIFVIGIVVAWLKARGRFMFLDNVVTNRARISEPWKEFKNLGNSLFLWSLGYGLICLFIFSTLLMFGYYSIIKPCYEVRAFVPAVIPSIISVIVIFVLVCIICAYISRFLDDFVVPIMYKQNIKTMAAWRKFLDLMKPSKWWFLLYGLFYALLLAAAGIGVMLVILLTCCIAICPLSLPYISSVLLLPVTVFFRAYSLEYLAQHGKEYDVFN